MRTINLALPCPVWFGLVSLRYAKSAVSGLTALDVSPILPFRLLSHLERSLFVLSLPTTTACLCLCGSVTTGIHRQGTLTKRPGIYGSAMEFRVCQIMENGLVMSERG
ncbi:hypothetical protein NXS19_001939 [Fusarium pseudograminearum]|nr:hypothetical protein NXS19_001939 [Fusarium pseudograminearum]